MGDQIAPTETELAALGLVVLVFAIGFAIGLYLLIGYVLSRIGRKFGIGSFGTYCVPVYNVVLLCRCGGISGWVAIGIFTFGLAGSLLEVALPLHLIATGFPIGLSIYLWGSIAQRLDKSFWLWGIGCGVLGIPILFLAFDSSRPVRGEIEHQARDSIIYDARFDDGEQADVEAFYDIPPVGGAPPVMRCTAGEYAGQTVDLPRDGIVIGRDPAMAHLVLQSTEVSASHVRIAPDSADGSTINVTDLGSTNGTYVRVEPLHEGSWRWQQVRGTYRDSLPCRIRVGDGVAEFEITSQPLHRLYS